jgi:glycosyltransferase involved in cell wall biosynthesis
VKASIIIDNFNYGRFVGAAIDSALAQTYSSVEVIVVDDGSTDDSRAVIARYGDRIDPVLKPNGGQASAFNAGFARSRGDVVVFLDADDLLLPTAVERAVEALVDQAVGKVHWPLWEIDAAGRRTSKLVPEGPLPDGDLRDLVVREGPVSHWNAPASGNAWSRRYLETALPMPDADFPRAADAYLVTLASAFGLIRSIDEPQGSYRVHGSNGYAAKALDRKSEHVLRYFERCAEALHTYLARAGIDVDPQRWRERNEYFRWMSRLHTATNELAELVEEGRTFLIVDDGQWGDAVLTGRRSIPFLERDGTYWGAPPDDETAIGELERMRDAGAEWIAFGWPAFWWLDHYRQFTEYLFARFRCVLKNERLVVFDLGRGTGGG